MKAAWDIPRGKSFIKELVKAQEESPLWLLREKRGHYYSKGLWKLGLQSVWLKKEASASAWQEPASLVRRGEGPHIQ